MTNPIVRFAMASLLAALVAVIVATITLPILLASVSTADHSGSQVDFLDSLIAVPLMLLFSIPIGGMIALPTTLVVGGIMVWLTARSPHLDQPSIWAIAAVLGIIPAAFLVGSSEDFYPDRIFISIWMALSGNLGALAFRWLWRRRLLVEHLTPS